MAVKLNVEEQCIEIEHLGITMRTLMAVGAQGYAQTSKRRWNIKYMNVKIASIQVASSKNPPARIMPKAK